MGRLQLITFLKGFSIFTIVLYHYFQYLNVSPIVNQVIQVGGSGIHLFFLLSGFGLYASYVGKPLGFLPFIRRRLGKIYIPYIVVVVVSAMISLGVPVFDFSWNALLAHLFLYKMFDSALDVTFGFQLWFVSTIIQFYFVFQVLVFLRQRMGDRWFLVTGLCISLAWNVVVVVLGKESLRSWNSAMFQYLWEFVLGMVIAGWYRSGKLPDHISRWALVVIGGFGFILYAVLALKLGQVGKVFNDYPALLAYSGMALLVYGMKSRLINRFFVFTGEIAFSVYLWHILVLLLLKRLVGLPGVTPVVVVVFSLIITYVVSVYYDRLINRFYKAVGL